MLIRLKLRRVFLFVGVILLGCSTQAQKIVNNKFGKGIYNIIAKDSSYSMKFAIRTQSLFLGTWGVNESEGLHSGNSQFIIRRSRLKFSGFAYSPKLKYKLELGLTNRDISGGSAHTKNAPRVIIDAVVKWNFYKNFSLWAGQTKLPGNRERVVSSANLQFVDRSLLNKNFNIDRDVGFQLRHHITLGNQFLIREIVSIAQGEGRNVTDKNIGGLQYTGRVELLPFGAFAGKGDYTGADLKREKTPKLAIGASYDYNNNAVKNKGNVGKYMERDSGGYFEMDINSIFIDGVFKYRGLTIMAEYAKRMADKDSVENIDGSTTGQIITKGNGINLQVGYLMKNNWEIAGRYTQILLNKEVYTKGKQAQYTFGLSKFIVGQKLKIQTDISYLDVQKDINNNLMYRMQFEVHF